jgi:hypothetical protein
MEDISPLEQGLLYGQGDRKVPGYSQQKIACATAGVQVRVAGPKVSQREESRREVGSGEEHPLTTAAAQCDEITHSVCHQAVQRRLRERCQLVALDFGGYLGCEVIDEAHQRPPPLTGKGG